MVSLMNGAAMRIDHDDLSRVGTMGDPGDSPTAGQNRVIRREVPFYGVTVYDHDGMVVTIEPAMLAGRDIGAREEHAIRSAIEQLRGFIGQGEPAEW